MRDNSTDVVAKDGQSPGANLKREKEISLEGAMEERESKKGGSFSRALERNGTHIAV